MRWSFAQDIYQKFANNYDTNIRLYKGIDRFIYNENISYKYFDTDKKIWIKGLIKKINVDFTYDVQLHDPAQNVSQMLTKENVNKVYLEQNPKIAQEIETAIRTKAGLITKKIEANPTPKEKETEK